VTIGTIGARRRPIIPLPSHARRLAGRGPSAARRTQNPRFLKGDPEMPTGYCVKERKKVEIKDPQQVTMKNGRPAIQGTCPDCGTKIFKIGKL
jgi:hypothetical protein